LGVGSKADDLALQNIIVVKAKEVKTEWSNSRQIWQNLLRKAVAQKAMFCP
jgi:hypothetical protein